RWKARRFFMVPFFSCWRSLLAGDGSRSGGVGDTACSPCMWTTWSGAIMLPAHPYRDTCHPTPQIQREPMSHPTRTCLALGLLAGLAPLTSAQVYDHTPDCDRACLAGFMDRYLEAQANNDFRTLPLATNVRITENG